MNELLLVFILLNIANVIIQTAKSIVTIKCGKGIAALVNAVAFGLYTVVTVYMLCELPLATKALIVALCNLVGVYVVKYVEEKLRKDKLWKVEATISNTGTLDTLTLIDLLDELDYYKIPHNYIDIKKYFLLNCYCESQEQSKAVKKILDKYHAKYFVSESKEL